MGENVELLASFRVSGAGMEYRAIPMNEDQRHERRSYIRTKLKVYPQWCNLSNDLLDQVLLYRLGDTWMLQDEDGRDYALPSKGITSKESEFRRVRAMMPFEFMNLTGKDFDWNKYQASAETEKELVTKYILNYSKFQEKGMGLYIFSGTKGSGKTMLSCCLLNEISKRYVGSVKFVNSLDFLEMTKKGFQGADEDIQALYNASLLVIDDIGVQMSKEWVDTVFYRLINERYINRKPTIYTSNLPIDSLRMDERITDRIDSTTYLVRLPEESIRKSTRQQEKNKLLNEIGKAP